MRYSSTLLLLLAVLLPLGCTQDTSLTPIATSAPRIRVLLQDNVSRIDLVTGGASASLNSQPLASTALPGDLTLPTTLGPDGWHFGRQTVPAGVLLFTPTAPVPIRINGVKYRGSIRLLPTSAGRFNVINETDVEDYLAGVVTSEMYPSWPIEAIKVQAVASRTYALYEARTAGTARPFDVFGDDRSQMYGGLSGETAKGRQAVADTQGLVLTYGPGDGTIFKAYFSACCGGVTQAASDAFPGERYIPPLAEQYHGGCDSGCKYFNWGPVVVTKTELARRFHIWAQRQSQQIGRPVPELTMASVYRIDIQGVNRYGRPNRVLITDTRGVQFSWPAEQLRVAVNTDAQPGSTLPSSFCKINGDPNSSSVTFYEGHGIGHGVGMSQWCADAEAEAGRNFAQILEDSYPQAKLERAY